MATRHIAALVMTTTLAGSGLAVAQTGGEDTIDPCEGGFYLADANRDGTITAEELEDAALKAFARFDTDGSGDVTQAEYEACGNAGAGIVGVPAQRVKSNLPEYDTNGDGQLSQSEFMNAAGEAYQQARIEANIEDGTDGARSDAQAAATAGTSDGSGAMPGKDGAQASTGGDAAASSMADDADQTASAGGDADEAPLSDAAQTAATGVDASAPAGGDAAEDAPAMAEGGSAGQTGAAGGQTAPAEGEPGPVVILRRFVLVPESQPGMNPARMSREAATHRALQTFSALDEDRSGKLEPEEWAKQRAVRRDMSDMLSSRFNQDDADKSGSLTPEEFVAAEERRRQEARNAYDENADSGAHPPVVYYRYPHVM